MAFTTDAQTLQDYSDALQQGGVSILPAFASNNNTRNHARAYQEIVTALAQRGYLLAQITQWDRGAEFERDMTTWLNLSMGGLGQNIDPKFIDRFDRRKELHGSERDEIKPVSLTIGGLFTAPAGTAGTVQSGPINTSDDVFVFPDPTTSDDPPGPGRGKPIRW